MPNLSSIKDKKFIIFAHNGGGLEGGWDDALYTFLTHHNAKTLTKLDFPFGADSKYSSVRIKTHSNGGEYLTETSSFLNFSKPALISYIKDFVFGLYFGLINKQKYDLFVGMDCLLSLVGIVLRRIGIIKKVATCLVDFTPIRFPNSILNKIYYSIDKYVCYNADYVLPLNKSMIDGRVEIYNYDPSRINFIETPFGNNSDTYTSDVYKKFNPKRLVYYGGVMQSKGADLFAKICKELVTLGHTDFELFVLGGGDIDNLKEQLSNENVSSYVNIFGRIDKHEDAEKILFTCGVALAPYFQADKNNFSYYADPGKIKVYLGCGLPVIITPVPPIHTVINTEHAGIVSNYDSKEFAKAVITIWDSYGSFKENAVRIGKLYSWNAIFSNLFSKVAI